MTDAPIRYFRKNFYSSATNKMVIAHFFERESSTRSGVLYNFGFHKKSGPSPQEVRMLQHFTTEVFSDSDTYKEITNILQRLKKSGFEVVFDSRDVFFANYEGFSQSVPIMIRHEVGPSFLKHLFPLEDFSHLKEPTRPSLDVWGNTVPSVNQEALLVHKAQIAQELKEQARAERVAEKKALISINGFGAF